MAFLETPRFPDDIRYDVSGGPMFSTDIVIVGSGAEFRNQNWSNAKGAWNLSHGPHNKTKTDLLISHFRAVGGMANGFRFKDWTDYAATVSEGRLTTAALGDGTPGPHLLYKRYLTGALSEDRKIQKPETVIIYRAASPVTVGAGAGNIALDSATGLVTWVADASASASSITPGATTVVVLPTNPGTLTNGQRLYLSGFTGADATDVNGIAHTISTVTGAGPYTFTLSTDTSGKTITLGAGLGAKYPQVSEALTWAGTFDVPVRFDTDTMQLALIANLTYQWSSVGIVEIRV